MHHKRVHILVVEPSLIIRRGIVSILFNLDSVNIDVAELSDLSSLKGEIESVTPDIIIINPLYLGFTNPKDLKIKKSQMSFIALQNSLLTDKQLEEYDAVISISDDVYQIEEKIKKIVTPNDFLVEDELSAREKEVVTAIALGKSNKEIADQLFISTHTVMTHRKNIASKLKIHNPAGLTIYAIVNKLIDINDAK